MAENRRKCRRFGSWVLQGATVGPAVRQTWSKEEACLKLGAGIDPPASTKFTSTSAEPSYQVPSGTGSETGQCDSSCCSVRRWALEQRKHCSAAARSSTTSYIKRRVTCQMVVNAAYGDDMQIPAASHWSSAIRHASCVMRHTSRVHASRVTRHAQAV